jgi:spoIIIJ-associated protein
MTDYAKIEQAQNIIQELVAHLGLDAKVEYEESITKGLIYNIVISDPYMLIGRQGSTLHSLEILAHALVSKKLKSPEPFYFTMDVDDYKRKREWYLKETARGAVEQLKRTGRAIALEPMPNYERRFVHAYLQEHSPEVYTESIGEDPHRKIVIKLKKASI